MNYWILTTEFPPFHGGGISTYNHHTALMLARWGVQVTVFVSDYHLTVPLEEEIASPNIRVIRFKTSDKPYYNYLGYHAAVSYHFAELVLAEIKKSGIPDFLEAQDYHGIGYYLLQQKRSGNPDLKNVPVILTLHSPSYYYQDHCRAPMYKLPDFWVGEMEKWTMRAADIFISPSRYLVKDNITEIGDKINEYNYIPNPYETDISGLKKKEVVKGDIIFFGKLTYQKGGLELIKNMTYLWDEGFEYPIKIVGDDHYFDLYGVQMQDHIIKKFKKYYDEGKIIFEGKLPPKDINARLLSAQVVIVPSIVDNFPYTVVESMIIGKVLLVSNGGGQAEIIEDGKSGFVYDKNDPMSFSEKLKKILSLSEEEYQSISKNAHERVSELCNYDNVFTQKMAVLKSYDNCHIPNIYPFTKVIERKLEVIDSNYISNRLSIVVPYYNTGKYIRETIQNLFSVNVPDKEIIIVNDGSNEKESLLALEKIAENFPIKIVNQKNMGLPGARNTGVKAATGEFLAFLDADDKVDTNYYPRAIELLKQYENVSFVGAWAQYFDGSTGAWPTFNPEPPYLLLHNPINSSSLIYKRTHFQTSGLNDMDMMPAYEDYESVIHLVKNGFRGIVIPELLFHYRIHPTSLSRTFNQMIHLDAFRLLTKKHGEFFKEYAIDSFHFLQANGPSHLYDNPTFAPHTDVQQLWERIENLNEEIFKCYNRQNPTGEARQSWYHLNMRNIDYGELFKENTYNREQLKIIKEWYHKEYDVLPLWFKRIGHIIKIATGHRKLFNKNR